MQYIKIGKRIIGKDKEPLIVSEIGINHNGSLDLAIKIADSAIDAGAEIIKHQTHVLDDEMANISKKIIPGNSNKSIYEIIKNCSLSEKKEKKLMQHIKSRGKIFFSTPFSRKAVERLENLKFHFIKLVRVNAIITH